MLTMPRPNAEEPNSEPRPRILIVEDERIVALHLRQSLAKLGYEVVAAATSGAGALHEIRRTAPDLILMDIHIDGDIDGIDTAAAISPELRIPVIYLTAYSEDKTLKRAQATHPYGYLLKPYNDRELHATIQMALDRLKVDRALQVTKERLSLALDSAEMGSWELDGPIHTAVHMDGADRIFGGKQDVFTGAWDLLLDRVQKEDRPLVEDMVERLATGGVAGEVEFRRPTEHGARWIKARCKQFTGGADDRTRIVGVMQDVTKFRENESSLRETAMEMGAQQQRLSAALAGANAANRAKSNFLAVMSHELRTPMNAILGFGQLLESRVYGDLNANQRNYVAYILEGGVHLLRLIDDLLDLGKIEAAKLDVTLERIELAPMLGRIAASLSPLADAANIALVTEFRGDLAVVADTTRLTQAVINLVSNAIKYSHRGGQVHIGSDARAEGWVRITVTDTGVGIPAQRQSEMFEPFNRLGAEHGAVEGTGIGMLLTKRLVELMGGDIGFESAADIGSKFWIDLPADRPAIFVQPHHDPLTGLPNRDLLDDRIGQSIALAMRQMRKIAVLSLQLGGLEEINRSFGHSAGDKVLQSVANCLVEYVRRSDTVTRQGTDGFIVLLSDIKDTADVAVLVKRMLTAVSGPHFAGEQELRVFPYAGVSIYPNDGITSETLIGNANTQCARQRKSVDA